MIIMVELNKLAIKSCEQFSEWGGGGGQAMGEGQGCDGWTRGFPNQHVEEGGLGV